MRRYLVCIWLVLLQFVLLYYGAEECAFIHKSWAVGGAMMSVKSIASGTFSVRQQIGQTEEPLWAKIYTQMQEK